MNQRNPLLEQKQSTSDHEAIERIEQEKREQAERERRERERRERDNKD